MNALEAMNIEIRYQVQSLQKQQMLRRDEDCLFIGSGDSYVAGLVAQHLSCNRAICCCPIDVIQNPSIVSGRNAYIISISGNTRANHIAAIIAKSQGARTTAITSRPNSPLAKACDRVIELKYKNTGVVTSGTISFSSSMIVCASLVTRLRMPDLMGIFMEADAEAERMAGKTVNKGSYFLLANGLLYPIAIYGALKLNEVFGAKAISYQVEEFCHSPIFSVKRNDRIIMIGGDGKLLNKRLVQEGFCSTHASFKATGFELVLASTFFVQLLVLKLAQKNNITNLFFLKNKRLLKTSSDFIYG